MTDDGVVLSDGEVIRVRYVLSCDGTRSTVWTSAGIEFPDTGPSTWGWPS